MTQSDQLKNGILPPLEVIQLQRGRMNIRLSSRSRAQHGGESRGSRIAAGVDSAAVAARKRPIA
jgi:hypothetical protein